MFKQASAALLICSITACGGGGDGTAPAPAPAPPVAAIPEPVVPPVAEPSPPPLSLALTAAAQSLELPEGGAGSLTFIATVSGTSSKPVVPVIRYDRLQFTAGAIDTSQPGHYRVTLQTLPDPSGGTKSSQFSFQLCEDAACERPYADTLRTLPVSVTVKLHDWNTMQRSGTHRGYVPLQLDPAAFTQLWSWSAPQSVALNPVATGEGKVFVTSDNPGQNLVYVLDEQTGKVQWQKTGTDFKPHAPAYANGMVYVRATEEANSIASTRIWAMDAKSGAMMRTLALNTNGYALAPVIDGGTLFSEGGYFSSGLSSFAVADGTLNWSINQGNAKLSAPALDDEHVYYYDGSKLFIYRRADGIRTGTITDPVAVVRNTSTDPMSAPVLGSRSNVLVLSGTQFTGFCCTSASGGSNRPIVNLSVDPAAPGMLWKTADGYLTQPALSEGVIYAGTGAIYTGASSGYTARFDAISEETGEILWSWTPPAPDISFYRNVVVTKNLAFVSTDKNVYAIDLKTHQAVWKAPYPGDLAIGANQVLLISVGGQTSLGQVVGIKLQ